MKKFLGLTLLFFTLSFFAQKQKALYVKGNALFLPIGILNAGLEYQLSTHYTAQADFLISPWKSFAGSHAQVFMGHLEGRYYFNEAFKHWYVGGNIGSAIYDIQKYNYIGTNQYQRGFNIMAGATVGYQMKWKENWNIDLYIGGGNSQGFYHGYETIAPNVVVRYDGANKWNKSGEWIPYRGGIMIAYKLK
ncbi:DUF3575 domain-containing protein [Halpernia sp. GG3]